ncbi:MAG: hypothetical protein ACTSSQ_03885 [Alphaproteobacteria bacterium]
MTLMLDDNFRPTRSLAILLAIYVMVQSVSVAIAALANTVRSIRKALVRSKETHSQSEDLRIA